MKVINYRGRLILAPDWVRYVSTDEDGCVRCFEDQPYQGDVMWLSSRGRDSGTDGVLITNDWKESLEAV